VAQIGAQTSPGWAACRGGIVFWLDTCEGEFMDLSTIRMDDIDVTLFVPCYNEEQNVIPTIESIIEACRHVDCSYEILVIDDASSDRSAEVISAYQEAHPGVPLRLVSNSVNMGLAYNFTEAALMGCGKYYRIVCGDNVEPVATQVAILSKMGERDLVIPYPLVVENKTWLRRVLSRTYTRLVNLVSGQRLRYWNGCALIRRHDVTRWHRGTRGFGFQAQLINRLLASGRTFVEVGCSYHERKNGKSKALTVRNFLSVVYVLLSIVVSRLAGDSAKKSANAMKVDPLQTTSHRVSCAARTTEDGLAA
jgi:glycosyltransferase involved in cell wall biosynthesis